MTSTLNSTLQEALTETPVSPERFRVIVAKLYASGIVIRDESVNEDRVYDDSLRIESILNDYFSLAGFRLEHNVQFNYFRLFPPGGAADGEDGEGTRKLRHPLTKDFAAYAMTLRHLYAQARDEGNLNERLEFPVSLEDVYTAMATLLRIEKPTQKVVRLETYRALRSQKLVRLPQNFDTESADTMLSIRPTVLDFVSDSQLEAIRNEAASHQAAAAIAPAPDTASGLVEAWAYTESDPKTSPAEKPKFRTQTPRPLTLVRA